MSGRLFPAAEQADRASQSSTEQRKRDRLWNVLRRGAIDTRRAEIVDVGQGVTVGAVICTKDRGLNRQRAAAEQLGATGGVDKRCLVGVQNERETRAAIAEVHAGVAKEQGIGRRTCAAIATPTIHSNDQIVVRVIKFEGDVLDVRTGVLFRLRRVVDDHDLVGVGERAQIAEAIFHRAVNSVGGIWREIAIVWRRRVGSQTAVRRYGAADVGVASHLRARGIRLIASSLFDRQKTLYGPEPLPASLEACV